MQELERRGIINNKIQNGKYKKGETMEKKGFEVLIIYIYG